MRALRFAIAMAVLAGCTGDGAFELVLRMPSAPELRPAGMTSVTVVLTSGDQPPVATTSVIEDNRFSAGDLPAADDVTIEVLLNNVSNRLVGVGESAEPVDILAGETTSLEIPVRRPFVYAAGQAIAGTSTALYSFDPTLDQTDPAFQDTIDGITGPRLLVAVGADRLAVVTNSQLHVISTDTNMVMGQPIALNSTAVHDAVAVPGRNQVAVGHAGGIAIVDLDTRTVKNAEVGPVERITVGPVAGKLYAYGLIGRTLPALSPLATCSGSSAVVAVDVDAPTMVPSKALPQAISDIAAAPETGAVFVTLPCAGKVARVEGDLHAEVANVKLVDVETMPRPAVVTVAGDRVWAAGTEPSKPKCVNASGNPITTCAMESPSQCPPSSSPPNSIIDHVVEGAHIVIKSIPIAGDAPITVDLPARRETILDDTDPAEQHAQVLKALGTVPLDLVVLPGGQYLGLVTSSSYFINELVDNNPILGRVVLLPCIDASTTDWLLLDMASTSIVQRVRTSCVAVDGPSDTIFNDWDCDEAPDGERPVLGEYTPLSVGAMFGAR